MRIPSEIRVPLFERGLIATYKSGSIMLTPAETIYFTVPSDLVELLHIKYGINFLNKDKRKALNIWASAVEERSATNNQQTVETLMLTIEEIVNEITKVSHLIDTPILDTIDKKINNAIASITKTTVLSEPYLRIIYEIERKPKK